MIRISLILLFIGGLFSQYNESPKLFSPIQKTFPLIWKAKVGAACFRGNILLDSNQVIFGSNGYSFMDYTFYDNLSGLYFLNSKNGKILKHVNGNNLGDMDINGVLLYQDKLYYGNDNEEFICANRNGDMLWRIPTSGDIEHEPILIKSQKINLIVYATETGEVCAIDPSNGNKYWSYFTPDFQGWKPGDNRAIFKVNSYFINTQSFFTKPAVADLNKDGTSDLIYVTDNGNLIALNGKNGTLLWNRIIKGVYDLTISNIGNQDNPLFAVKEILWDGSYYNKRNMLFINAEGQVIREHALEEDMFRFGLNSVHTLDGMTVFCFKNSLYMTNASGYFEEINRTRNYKIIDYKGDSVVRSRNSNVSVISQTIFSYKGNSNCIFVLNQHDDAFLGNGFVEIISLDSKKILGTWQIPSASELAPVIADVNTDGTLDVLISGYDGYLYCYNLEIPVKNIQYLNTKN